MKINVSGLSIIFYLFCGAVIISEYSYVGNQNAVATARNGYFKKNGAIVEVHNRPKVGNSKKENWPSRSPASQYSGNFGLNK
ncbi:MAG: hypothetical protein WA160_13420 [Pseudobdellovibrio sp.]